MTAPGWYELMLTNTRVLYVVSGRDQNAEKLVAPPHAGQVPNGRCAAVSQSMPIGTASPQEPHVWPKK